MDKDFIDELLESDEPAKPEGSEPATQEPKTQTQSEDLDKKAAGFYKDLRDERRKRQELQSELDRVKGTINAILEMKRNPAADIVGETKSKGIPVKETESGELFVNTDDVKNLNLPYEDRIKLLEQELQRAKSQSQAESEAQRIMEGIVGENEEYSPAYQKYKSARQWVNDRVIEFQRENRITGAMSSASALDHVFDDQLEGEFKKNFPGFHLEDVVQAEDSKRLFKRMLNNSVELFKPKEPTTDPRFRKVLSKPSGLAGSSNAKAGQMNISEKLAALSTEDIMNLSDKEIAALEKALLAEERSDGIMFK